MTRLGDALAELSAAGIYPPSRTSALDTLAPPPPVAAGEPDDVLSDLLAVEPIADLAPADENDILVLDRLKQRKALAEKQVEDLGREIERVQARLMEMGVEQGLIDKRGRLALGAVDNGQGFMVKPYEVRTTWPKYRIDPRTDQPYTRDQLIEAMRTAGLGHLVVDTTAQYDWPGYVRERVKEWRQTAGRSGARDDQDRFVDLDGELLDAIESRDPTADILALPRALRVVVEPVDQIVLQVRRTPIAPPAAPADDAAPDGAVTAGD